MSFGARSATRMRRRRHIRTHSSAAGLVLSLLWANISVAQPSSTLPTTILIDREMSPTAGASATVTAGRIMASLEDRLVPLRLFEERGRLRRTTNATYRLAKLVLFDDP